MIKKLTKSSFPRKTLFSAIAFSVASSAIAQVKVGNNPATLDPTAAFEVESTTKGFLPPRMLQMQMNAIVSPAIGLMVYCMDCTPAAPYFYNGTIWATLSGIAATATFSNGTLSCSGTLAGNYSQATAMNSGNTKTITITAVTGGTYTATTNTVNGVAFAASGSLLSTGANTPIVLTATGTPIAPGSFTYTASMAGQTCTFGVTYTASATFNCAGITNTLPTPLTNGQPYNTGSVSVPYTAGNGASYATTAVGPNNGLTLTRTAGTFISGGGNVVYTIGGTYTGTTGNLVSFTLPESGCVVSAGNASYTAGTLLCTGALSGSYQEGAAMTSGNTKVVSITAATVGGYSAATNTVNGVSFSGTGNFGTAGSKNVTLTATGAPTANGSFTYTVSLGGQTCDFNVSYAGAATFNCSSPTFTQSPAGGLVNNTAYTGSYTLPYSAGNGASYSSNTQTVNGLTFARVAGTYAPGGGNIVYNLSGTYTGSSNSISFPIAECGSVSFPSGLVSTIAGDGTYGLKEGPAASAWFNTPQGIGIDVSSGNIYVGDRNNHRIRMITPAGVVSTLAGGNAGFNDATGPSAQFNNPTGLAVDAAGNVYVADRDNNRIRKVTTAGVVTTFAGNGTAGTNDATGTAAQFNGPTGLAFDAAGNLYVADAGNHRIRMITSTGVVSTLAGSSAGFNNATGAAAQFNAPTDVSVDASNNVYVADRTNNAIRKITPGGVVTTLAGGTYGYVDATGSFAQFQEPVGITVDAAGNAYVSDYNNNRIRKVTNAGVVTTVAGSNSGFANGSGAAAQFNYPYDLVTDAAGNIIVVDQNNNRIRKITP